MNNNSRTKNSIKNVGVGSFLQLFALLLSFVTRTIFIKLLGIEYLSVDGLFSNILTLLNFTELGIGSAIIFSLYEPIANNDQAKIGALMNLIRKAYIYIALTIFVVGLIVIPILPYLIKDVPDVKENLVLLYILFLLNTVCTYVYSYKKSLLIADQKNYVVLIIYQCVHLFMILGQIVLLLLTHNYVLYLLLLIICTLINNVLTTKYVDKHYVWLNDNMSCELSRKSRNLVFANIRSIALYKLGSVILNGTNSIVISVFIKTVLVGYCSNYLLITNSVTSVINQGMSGLMASVGNYNVNARPDENERLFQQLDFLMFTGLSFISIGLCIFMNDFITLWIGRSYVLSNNFVYVIVLSFYVMLINTIPSTFRTAMGLFERAKYYPFLAALINLILSIVFAKFFGLLGVFVANIIARLGCYTLVDAKLIYKYGFKNSSLHYYKISLLKLLYIIVTFFLISIIFDNLSLSNSLFLRIIQKSIVFLLVFFLTFYLCWWNDKSFKMLRSKFKCKF